jgi:hypothetical protein
MRVKNYDCIIIKVLTSLNLEIHIDLKKMLVCYGDGLFVQTENCDLCESGDAVSSTHQVCVSHLLHSIRFV